MMQRTRTLLLAAALAVSAGAPLADSLDLPESGIVFFSPEQRAEIEARRRAALAGTVTPGLSGEAAPSGPPAAAPRQRRLDGVARRGDGRRVAWFDGERVADRDRWNGYVVRVEPGRVLLESAGGRRLTLRVGDAVDLDTGRVESAGRRG